MARRTRDEQARFRLLQSYERAKRSDPSITQAEFINRGLRESGQKPMKSDSAARYFRKIRTGERTGSNLYRKSLPQVEYEEKGEKKQRPSSRRGLYQIEFTDAQGRRVASKNLSVFGGAESTFDIAAIEAELKEKHSGSLNQIIEAYARRYDIPQGMAAERFRVRLVRQQKRTPFALVFTS